MYRIFPFSPTLSFAASNLAGRPKVSPLSSTISFLAGSIDLMVPVAERAAAKAVPANAVATRTGMTRLMIIEYSPLLVCRRPARPPNGGHHRPAEIVGALRRAYGFVRNVFNPWSP